MSQPLPPLAFPPLGPEYEAFLYAVVCDEENGMPLTMISAIARSGSEPWAEAARIARLPKKHAVEALARLIPDRGGDNAAIADRFLALLPTFAAAKSIALPRAIQNAPRWSPLIPLVIALLIGLALASAFKQPPLPDAEQGRPVLSAPPVGLDNR